MKKDIGDLFQKETKYIRGKLGGGARFGQAQPETYKRYPQAPKVKLELPEKDGGMPFGPLKESRWNRWAMSFGPFLRQEHFIL
jgi:hypothetical protein